MRTSLILARTLTKESILSIEPFDWYTVSDASGEKKYSTHKEAKAAFDVASNEHSWSHPVGNGMEQTFHSVYLLGHKHPMTLESK